MAKIVIKGGRRVAVPAPTVKEKERSRRAPVPTTRSQKAEPSATRSSRTSPKAAPVAKDFKLDGLSLKGLLRATPPYIKNNAAEVIIKSLQEATTKGGFPGIRAKALSVGNKGQRHIYGLDIIGKEKDIPLSKQKHVLVSCQCDFFLYYCEVALNHWGSSRIKYSNGENPVVTNPQLHPLMCKHLVKLAKTVIEEGF